MNEKKSQQNLSSEALLADIETLMQHDDHDKETINPSLLAYLDLETLISVKQSLLKRSGKISQEDKAWLEQFKKYE